MTIDRRKPPYWRRCLPEPRFDISKLRPKTLPRGKRFETRGDASEESIRREEFLKRYPGGDKFVACLQECRDGRTNCDRPYCPRCARIFRRHIIGELLRLNEDFEGDATVLVVLLETAARGKLLSLEINPYRHSLRKRLERVGLSQVPIIGGFEVAYQASSKKWVLHANLVVLGGEAHAFERFASGFVGCGIDRPTHRAVITDPASQLSYILKFTTYHRPYQQSGGKSLPQNR